MGNNASHNIKSTMDKCSASHYTSWVTGVSFMYASWLLVAFAEGREHCTVRRPLSAHILHADTTDPVFRFIVSSCVCVCVKSHNLLHLPFALVAKSESALQLEEWVKALSAVRSSAPVFRFFLVILSVCHNLSHLHLHWLQVRELLEWVSEAPFCSFPRCWTGAPPLFATPGGRKAASQLALSQSEASPLRSQLALSECQLALSEGAVSLTDFTDQCIIWRQAKVPWSKSQKKPQYLQKGPQFAQLESSPDSWAKQTVSKIFQNWWNSHELARKKYPAIKAGSTFSFSEETLK